MFVIPGKFLEGLSSGVVVKGERGTPRSATMVSLNLSNEMREDCRWERALPQGMARVVHMLLWRLGAMVRKVRSGGLVFK